ncbi:hypothetical protein E2C01_048690 [Portunus trituberculatus]|uniref:Ig-like domain-containing protein n=1 Tax=Portunus trituberculatus TaxID=210409 RepID=A0A5B7GBR5_PORTR|nr:hypothetical protein [Portunus trituberculatus]
MHPQIRCGRKLLHYLLPSLLSPVHGAAGDQRDRCQSLTAPEHLPGLRLTCAVQGPLGTLRWRDAGHTSPLTLRQTINMSHSPPDGAQLCLGGGICERDGYVGTNLNTQKKRVVQNTREYNK